MREEIARMHAPEVTHFPTHVVVDEPRWEFVGFGEHTLQYVKGVAR